MTILWSQNIGYPIVAINEIYEKGTALMWPKSYRDYKTDDPLVQNQVETGKAIIGCEMHDINGWGHSYHTDYKKKRRGLFESLFFWLKKEKHDTSN